ncbi:unnamed protein product [Euphydryas editha]|uniref:Uncharacterized protein n=1 Tax=Euphydryas editha TaxID=104508 RepID=A0AAU9UTV5_EUPED|nr:unnamed protein product [Euphydryas editha]
MKILEKERKSKAREIKRAKKPGSSTMKFVFPDVEDKGSVGLSDIVLILPDPKSANTARSSSILSFINKDLSFYNIY